MGLKKIDSHQHFLKPDKVSYCWMKPDMPLAKDFLPSDLKPWLEKHNVEKTILVEAADSDEENKFMFKLAEENQFIGGVVIWLDMESPGFADNLAHYLAMPKFVGIRPMIESIGDERWMLRPAVKKSFGILQAQNVCFDFLSHPKHLPYVLEILNEFPGLRTVINHISKPLIKDGVLHPWTELIEKVAAHKNVYCKLSGMITEAEHQSWKPADLTPYIRHILKVFGPHRCMFGSDWPVCLLAGTYDDVVEALQQNISDLNPLELQDIFWNTASRFYRI
jgi:L-fuconolactonase